MRRKGTFELGQIVGGISMTVNGAISRVHVKFKIQSITCEKCSGLDDLRPSVNFPKEMDGNEASL